MARRTGPADRQSAPSPFSLTGIYIVFVALCVLSVPLGAFWGTVVTFREAGLLGLVPLAAGLITLVSAWYIIQMLAEHSPLLQRMTRGPRKAG